VLSIDLDPRGTILVDRRGAPVWPISSAAEFEKISTFCETYGISLRHVSGRLAQASAGNGTVAAFGDRYESEARLYAHLTGRGWRLFRSAEDILADPGVEIIIAHAESLNDIFLSALTMGDRPRTPGIICEIPPFPLRPQTLIRAAAAARLPVRTVSALLFPTKKQIVLRGTRAVPFFGRSSALRLKALASGRASYLAIMTHSDGVDAFLGHQVICAMRGLPDGIDRRARQAPSCVSGGRCHRAGVAIGEIGTSDRLLPVGEIRSWIVTMGMCWGMMLEDDLVAPEWSLGAQLINSSSIGALVTTWKIALDHPENHLALENRIAAGAPVGEALADMHRTSSARRLLTAMCLFGDPRTRAFDGSPVLSIPVGERPATKARALCQKQDFLNYCAGKLYGEERLGQIASDGAASPVAVRRARMPSGASLVRALAASERSLADLWMPDSLLRPLKRKATCWICRGKTRKATVYIGRFPGRDFPPRRISICPLCGIIEDVPAGLRLRLTFADGLTAKIESSPAVKLKFAILGIRSAAIAPIVRTWPSDGRNLAHSLALPAISPATGIFDVVVTALSDRNLLVAGRRMRAGKPPPASGHNKSNTDGLMSA
jgi:hypothetical protein